MRNPLRIVLHRIAEKDPLLLSHHPSCQYYQHHTFTLYGTQLCMGCFIVYPIGLLTLLSLSLAWLLTPNLPGLSEPTYVYYATGGLFAIPIIVAKTLQRSQSRQMRITSKILLAVGLGVAGFPLISQPGDRLLTLLIFAMFLIPYIGHKGVTALDDCQGCPEKSNFPNCSGFEFEEAKSNE